MQTNDFIIYFSAGISLGLLFGWLAYRVYHAGIRYSAELEANELLAEAKDRSDLQALEEKEKISEIEAELWNKVESEHLKLEETIEELEELAQEKKQKNDTRVNQEKQKTAHLENEIKNAEGKVQFKESKLNEKKNTFNSLRKNYVENLLKKIELAKEDILQELSTQYIFEVAERAKKVAEQIEEQTKEECEILAKSILDTALSRFARPYCGERGISSVYFELPEQRQILCDPAGKNLEAITQITGCDVYVSDDSELVGVAGFDPVRRELTRRILERILKERRPVNVAFIQEKAEHIRRELFAVIRRDGDMLAKELHLHNLHPEIRQVMGSLRYRYSFTQNQYFHCGEVGWLCGLLAQELKTVEYKKAKRAGMLHDLGKAMDHVQDGGHAMIGSNFIEARGEAADIVHAVRAHHFDEAPSTDLAFLVIAADAISGARPGARRSTMENYTQKVTELDSIARSFDGVTDCFVLNGGRELRVLVNSKKVDDLLALKINKDIAHRIEEECNYPGQIKVVVVRETFVTEMTRGH